MEGTTPSPALRETIARLAPGTALRDGLERILRGRTGGLIVLGYDDEVEAICDGGFELDVEFAPTRLRELSKMDGAVVLSTDGKRIVRANVQLVPDHKIPTVESGTRHRAAELRGRKDLGRYGAVRAGFQLLGEFHQPQMIGVCGREDVPEPEDAGRGGTQHGRRAEHRTGRCCVFQDRTTSNQQIFPPVVRPSPRQQWRVPGRTVLNCCVEEARAPLSPESNANSAKSM